LPVQEAMMDWSHDQYGRTWKRQIGERQATVLRVVDSDTWFGVDERIGSRLSAMRVRIFRGRTRRVSGVTPR
jgi:hypothetical protein